MGAMLIALFRKRSHRYVPFTRSPLPLFFLLLAFVFGCGNPPAGRGAGEVESAGQQASAGQTPAGAVSFRVETVVGNLEVPWSIVWAPDGRMFFSERGGRIRIFENGKLRAERFSQCRGEPRREWSDESRAHPQF